MTLFKEDIVEIVIHSIILLTYIDYEELIKILIYSVLIS